MEQDWVKLSHLYQRRGLANMPNYLIATFTEAFQLAVDQPAEEKPDTDWFIKRLRLAGRDIPDQIVDKLREKNYPVYRPVWHPLTVDQIEVNMNQWPNPTVRLIPGQYPAAVYRPRFHYPAFSIFWALIFHTENEFLRRPDIIWQELEKRTNHFVNLERQSDEMSEAYWQYYLALYERILGVQYDINNRLPHYLANVVDRVGLKPEESRERPELFQTAVTHLIACLEKKLLK